MIKHVAVLGAGTMGAGIAQVFAEANCVVYLYDVNDTILRRARERVKSELKAASKRGNVSEADIQAISDRIRAKTYLPDISPADLVIEAVIEDQRTKQDLLRRVEEIVKGGTILASNTSSLPITSIASNLRFPATFLGLHFFNPAHTMKLVEVIQGHRTSNETVERALGFVNMAKKTPVLVKDSPGFIVNRVAHPFYSESMRIAGEQIATVSQVDRILTSVGGFRLGPFESMDLAGIDMNLDITRSMFQQFHGEPRYRPHLMQERMVESGKLGKKVNEGFYRYDEFRKTKIDEER